MNFSIATDLKGGESIMATRVKYGKVSLSGKATVNISYSGFSGTPSVTASVISNRNGATVRLTSVSSGSATLKAFYNGGLELTEGTIHWIAVGPTSEIGYCGCEIPPHPCSVCKVFQ